MGPKEDKAKHGLMIRPKYLILALARAQFWGEKPFWVAFLHLFKVLFGSKRRKGKKKKKKKEEEKFKKSRFGISLFEWNFGMELMFGNTCLSWVRKTLTLQYMCILVGLSQFCSFVLKWFDLVKRFPVKMAKADHFCF